MKPQNPSPMVSKAHTPNITKLAPGVYCTPDGTDTKNNPLKPCIYVDANTHMAFTKYQGYKAPGEFLACTVVMVVGLLLVASLRRWESTPARQAEREHYRAYAKKKKRELSRRRKRYYYDDYHHEKEDDKTHK